MINNSQSSADLSVHTVENDTAYLEYLKSTQSGIGLIPEPYGEAPLSLKSDGIDFAKWVKQTNPELSISLPTSSPKVSLHSSDVWLPLIYLAGETSMSIFLGMISSYLYDKAKGKLLSDKPKIHLSVMYQNKKDGVTKRFDFSGDSDSLSKATKRFDLDNFFDETIE